MTENPLLWEDDARRHYQDKLNEAELDRQAEESGQTVVGLFKDHTAVGQALDGLHRAGFTATAVSVVTQDDKIKDYLAEKPGHVVAEVAGRSALGGTIAGGATGLLAGIGAVAIPGLGPIMAAGAITTILGATAAGAGVGAAAGGLVGALIGMGLAREKAEAYSAEVQDGSTLIIVQTENKRLTAVYDAMERAGAETVENHPTA